MGSEQESLAYCMKVLGYIFICSFYPTLFLLKDDKCFPGGAGLESLQCKLWRGFAWMPFQDEFTYMVALWARDLAASARV